MEGSKKGTGIFNKRYEHRQFKKSRFFEEQRKASEEADPWSCLQKMEAEYAEYLRGRYFSGKDIFGEEIFEVTNIDGHEIRTSRISPIKSFADPVAYLKEVEEIKSKSLTKSLADNKNTEGSRRPPPPEVNDKGKKVCSPSMQDSDDESSDSLEELSIDEWNEIQSAIRLEKSRALPFKKRNLTLP